MSKIIVNQFKIYNIKIVFTKSQEIKVMMLVQDNEFYHPNNLWYKTYDQQCYSKGLTEINFSRYIALVTTHSLYKQWKENAMSKLDNWSNKALSLFEILELFNQFFDPKYIDKRLLYVQNKRLRKLVISFQFWILCQRYYALLFYSLDSLQFGDDRNMATLTRIFKYFCQFFSNYKKKMFEQKQSKDFMEKLHMQLMSYQKSQTNRWATILCNNIITIQSRYLNGQEIDQNDFKHEAYYAIIKEITQRTNDTIQQIQNRLLRNYQKRQNVLKANERKRWNNLQFIDELSEVAKKAYDPQEMMELQRQRLQKQKSKPNRNKNVDYVLVPKQGELKSELTLQKQSVVRFPGKKYIIRSANNPYHYKNDVFNTFISELVAEESPRKQGHKAKVNQQKNKDDSDGEQKEDIDTIKYYQQQYLDKIKKIPSTHAKVTKFDIADDISFQKEELDKQTKALGKIVDEKWLPYDKDQQYWYTGGVYGPVETQVNQKYMKILQIDSDPDDDEQNKYLYRKYIKKQMDLEQKREEQYNDEKQHLNINQLALQKKKSNWYFVKNLYTQTKIKNSIDQISKPRGKMCFVYPWNPQFTKKKLTIL